MASEAFRVARPPSDSFAPDPIRAAKLDEAVRLGLASSLRTVFESLDDAFTLEARAAERLLDGIAAGPVKSRIFAVYVDLVMALFQERPADAAILLEELLAQDPAVDGPFRILTLDDRDLGDGQAERYRRLVNDDVQFVLEPVSPAQHSEARAVLGAAFDLLEAAAPKVGDEVRALFHDVVLVTNAEGRGIGGASSFALWGTVLLNIDCLSDRLTAAVALAHEAAHAHLFGLALGGRLVENSDDDRYASPLRSDLRPMEGIAHAVYVLGRMIFTLRALRASGRLSLEESEQARAQLGVDRGAYDDGLATVLRHARFTPAGAGAFEDLRRYMEGD